MKLATTTGDLWGYTGSQEKSMQYIREAGFRYMDYNFGCDYGNRSGVYSDGYLAHFGSSASTDRQPQERPHLH